VASLIFIDFTNPAKLMISTGSFEEFSGVVADSRLTEFKLKYGFSVAGRVNEKSGAIVICLSLDRVLVL